MSDNKITFTDIASPLTGSGSSSADNAANRFLDYVEQLLPESNTANPCLLDEMAAIADALEMTQRETGISLDDPQLWDSIQNMAAEHLDLPPEDAAAFVDQAQEQAAMLIPEEPAALPGFLALSDENDGSDNPEGD
jgi:hypothetical protein